MLFLILALVWLQRNQTPVAPEANQGVVQTQVTRMKADIPKAMSASAEPTQKPFRWSQLQSADYAKFVANLRAADCPEKTLRAIVSSDLDTVYENRAQELQARLAELQKAPLSARLSFFSTIQALQAQLQQLSAQESEEIANLLGSPVESRTTNPELGKDASAVNDPRSTTAPAPPQMPLVMQDVDPSALGLNAEQRQIIQDLRQSFSEAVGGPDQDPNDPSYLARWQKAQPDVDNQLRGMLGVKIAEQYEMAVQPESTPPSRR